MPMAVKKECAWLLVLTHLDDVSKEIENLFKLLASPKEGILDKLKCTSQTQPVCLLDAESKERERRMPGSYHDESPDITKLPVITCWPKDGGPFVTLPVIHTKDPNTGTRNVGMYRMQVFGPTAYRYALA